MTQFSKKGVSFRSTGYFSELISDYLENSSKTESLAGKYPPASSWADFFQNCRGTDNRDVLASVLEKQYEGFLPGGSLPEKVVANIRSLRSPETFTITTGHQLNFFSGPLYVMYKLLSVIRLAEQLKASFPDKHFVPVYWMASEDHDIDEIDHLQLFNKPLKYQTDYRGPSGKMKLNEVKEFTDSVVALFGDGPYGETVKQLIEASYQNDVDLATATFRWVNSLFGKYGLVILDPNSAELKKQFVSVMKDDLLHHSAYGKVNETIRKLEENKYPVQVQPREINLFYLHGKERSRIVKESDVYKIMDSDLVFSQEQIVEELIHHPERFSPNVVLRPMYQQTVMPNIAYVGGPAELAYWFEFKSAFDHYKVSYPLLVLRNCLMIVDQVSAERWKKLGFAIEDLFNDDDELIKGYLNRNMAGEFSVNGYAEQFAKIFDRLNSDIESIDPTLRSSADAERQRLSNSLKQLEQKITRALKRKNETEINQIRKVKERLFPSGNLQERVETMLPFLLKFGPQFIDQIYSHIDPLSKEFSLLIELPFTE